MKERNTRRQLEMADKLKNICSDEAKRAIQKLVLTSGKKGHRVPYEKMLEVALVYESMEKNQSNNVGYVFSMLDKPERMPQPDEGANVEAPLTFDHENRPEEVDRFSGLYEDSE